MKNPEEAPSRSEQACHRHADTVKEHPLQSKNNAAELWRNNGWLLMVRVGVRRKKGTEETDEIKKLHVSPPVYFLPFSCHQGHRCCFLSFRLCLKYAGELDPNAFRVIAWQLSMAYKLLSCFLLWFAYSFICFPLLYLFRVHCRMEFCNILSLRFPLLIYYLIQWY